MTEQHPLEPEGTTPPRRSSEPAVAATAGVAGRRQAVAIGAGLVAFAGLAAGATTLLSNSAPGADEPLQDSVGGGAPLNLNEPILSTASPEAPTPSPAPSPSTSSAEPHLEASMRPTETPSPSQVPVQQSSSTSMEGPARVLQDPMEPEEADSMEDTGATETTPESNESTEASLAPVEPSEVYLAPPGTPTLEGTTALAPNVTLRTTPEWHLARRAAIGTSAIIAAEIQAQGITSWIDNQLAPETLDDSRAEAIIKRHFPWSMSSTAEVATQTSEISRINPQVTNALITRLRFTTRVLAENVLDALANHIYVPIAGKAPQYSGEYDQVLRKNGLGRYADTLHALLTHPALLIELDNQVNTKANPNENLGRELLELYTVGVGNYTEDDVRDSALLLTGHGVDWDKHSYIYREGNHHTGALQIMGFSDANSDAAQGPDLLKRYVEYLASHQGTAQRLARRFAVRFISDDPSQSTVDALAQAYLDADTSISALVRATLTHPDFGASVGQKWRRPSELVSTISRAAQVSTVNPRGTIGGGKDWDYGLYGWLIRTGRDLPRAWPIVDGYPDTADYWNSASITLPMLNATQDAVLGDKHESGVTSWSKALSVAAGDNAMETAKRLSWHLTGYAWPDEHLSTIAGLLIGDKPADASSTLPSEDLDYWVSQAVRVIFASPYGSLR